MYKYGLRILRITNNNTFLISCPSWALVSAICSNIYLFQHYTNIELRALRNNDQFCSTQTVSMQFFPSIFYNSFYIILDNINVYLKQYLKSNTALRQISTLKYIQKSSLLKLSFSTKLAQLFTITTESAKIKGVCYTLRHSVFFIIVRFSFVTNNMKWRTVDNAMINFIGNGNSAK